MSELSELRERVSDLEVTNGRLDERVANLKSSVDALRVQLNPLVLSAAKGKAWLAAIALISAVLGASVKEAIVSLFQNISR